MRLLKILLVIVVLAAVVLFFTRPSDDFLRAEATKAVIGQNQTTPGYENPADIEESNAPTIDPQKIIIENKLLWKKVRYTSYSEVQTVGYGILNSFYDVSEKRKRPK